MAIKLHRCGVTWLRTDMHPCWVVQKALDEMDVPYEVVREPLVPRSRRTRVIEATGQHLLPAIELEDGRWLHEESHDLARRIRAGRLLETRAGERD